MSGSHPYYQIKKTLAKAKVFFMGRIVGFEPTHIGTTIRGLNRLTISAMFPTNPSIPNQDFKASRVGGGVNVFMLGNNY